MPPEMEEDIRASIEELGGEKPSEGAKPPENPATEEVTTPSTGPAEPNEQEQLAGDGKTAPETPAKSVPADTQSTAPVAGQQTLKAPASWKPEEREGWEALPTHVKQAVFRREREIMGALEQTAQVRNFATEFQRIVQPYQHYIAMENSTPLQAVENMFRTAAVLRSATPQQKAVEVAQLIAHYAVDINHLDTALQAVLSGRAPQVDPVERMLAEKLQPVNQLMEQLNQLQQSNQASQRTAAEQEWNTFVAKPEFEFANDLREEIADILDLATKRGQVLDLPTAYARATMLHPTISKIVEARKLNSVAAQQTAAARRAKDAAASVSGTGAPSRGGEDSGSQASLRADLESSLSTLSGRT